jgi:hypothetical protein
MCGLICWICKPSKASQTDSLGTVLGLDLQEGCGRFTTWNLLCHKELEGKNTCKVYPGSHWKESTSFTMYRSPSLMQLLGRAGSWHAARPTAREAQGQAEQSDKANGIPATRTAFLLHIFPQSLVLSITILPKRLFVTLLRVRS